VTRVSPLALPPDCTNCLVTLKGTGFGVAGSVAATCFAPGETTPLDTAPVFPAQGVPSDTTLVIEGDAFADLPNGTACWLRVVNNDGSVKPFGEASQPVVVAGGLAPVKATDLAFASLPPLTTVRRAPAVVVAQVAPGRRYLYALGGDGGNLSFPRNDVEAAPLGFAGSGAWQILPRSTLPSATTLAGAATDGRFIYVVGGHDGTASLGRVTRAEVLTPVESPRIHDVGIALDFNSAGLAGSKRYWYRVAARFDSDDALNPGGESLASPAVSIALATVAQGFDVLLSWSPGDTAGRSLAGWRIYRGEAPDQIDKYIDVAPSTVSFTDDGSLMTASQTPLAMGALGRFRTTGMPNLVTPRAGAAVVIAPDPSVTGRWYLYAGFGWSSASATPLPASYEVAQIDGAAIGNFGETGFGSAGRWLLGGWSYTPERHLSSNEPHVFFGQGTKNLTLGNFIAGDSVMEVSGGKVGSGGALTAVLGTPPVVDVEYGYGSFSGGDRLIMLGGALPNDRPAARTWTAPFGASAPLPDAWTSATLLPDARFLPGVASDGPYVYVVGGGADFSAASSSVSFGIY
jgi:hypothetical protein